MPDSILSHEPIIRLAAFAGILAGMAAWEVLAPRRDLHARRLRRWPNNLAIVVLDTFIGPSSISAYRRGSGAARRDARMGPFQRVRGAGLAGDSPGGDPARPCDLSPARFVSRGPAAVAAAPRPPCRSRLRRDHGGTLPSVRNRLVGGDQAGGRARAWSARRRRGAVRNSPERDLAVQPRQRSPSARAGPRPAAGSS